MFDNLTNISLYNYEVNLDTIVRAVCEISIDIGKQLEELIELKDQEKGFTILDLFADEFLLDVSVRPEEVLDRSDENGTVVPGIGKEGLIGKITVYFNEEITKNQDFEKALQSGTEVLVLNRKETRFLGNGEKGKERLLTAIKKTKVLKILVSKLKSEKIQKSLEKLEIFENDIFYKNVIGGDRLEGQPVATLVPYEILNADNLEAISIDERDIWINVAFYKKQIPEFTGEGEVSILLEKESKKEIGIFVNNFVIPNVNVDLSHYVKEEFLLSYYFNSLKRSYTKKKRDATERGTPIIQQFIDKAKNPKLNQLLSHLKNNFYIDGSTAIDAEFAEFFNSVVSFEQLDLLEDYHFLLSASIEQETALGVYSKTKKQQEYNLIHWMNHEGVDNLHHYRKERPSLKKKNFVSTLKPAICYYFVAKYFEDFVETILKKNGNIFFSNHQIIVDYKEFTEIDFFIQSPDKLIYVEAKTKLTKLYIENFLKRSSMLIDKFKPIAEQGITIEFMLLGCFSDSTVADYQYFIDESPSKEDGYNTVREGLNCIPYNFKIPIPDKEGRTITCVAEPEFDKLQKLLLEICPK